MTVMFGYIVMCGTISTKLVAVYTSCGYERVVLASTSNTQPVHVLLEEGLIEVIGKIEKDAGRGQ